MPINYIKSSKYTRILLTRFIDQKQQVRIHLTIFLSFKNYNSFLVVVYIREHNFS